MASDDEIRKLLEKDAKLREVAAVRTFDGFRHTPDGGSVEVTVEIYDHGAETGDLRYHIRAHTKDGRFATGNPERTVDMALHFVHWNDLDKPGRT